MKTYVGHMSGKELNIGIVVSRFNELVTKELKESAIETLLRHQVDKERIQVVEVPGAFEIPVVAKRLIERGEMDAVIALGAIIRGDTPHFDYVAGEVASGIQRVSLDSGKPVIFGILTTDTGEQAIERLGVKFNNKGAEAAETALEMANVLKEL